MADLLLIYPPLAKNCEPPAGVARIAGVLRANGLSCSTVDANRTGLNYLLGLDFGRADTWSRRAAKNLKSNIAGLQDQYLYNDFARYKRAVADVNRVLAGVGEAHGLGLSLSDYQDIFSPVRSADLLQAARQYRDNIFYPFFRDEIGRKISKCQPDYLGISIAYLSQAVVAFALIGFVRAQFPDLKIIIGGSLVTSWLRSPLWKNPFQGLVDYCHAGPGEQYLLELIVGQGKILKPAPPQYDCSSYLAPGFILPYAASSGCYWNKCLFCPETAEDNPYLPLPPEQVLADIRMLKARHQPILLHFLDNAISPALLEELAANPPGISWYGFARISRQLADEDFCRRLRSAGCVMLKLGLESGDQQVLEQMNKGIKLEMAAMVLRALHGAGIRVYVYLLFGTPGENEEAALRTLEFTARHAAEIGFLNLAVFNMPLAGPEAAKLKTCEFYQGDLSLYTDFSHPLGWERKKIRRFLSRKLKRHPAIAPIIQRDPPFFTSNHAPFF